MILALLARSAYVSQEEAIGLSYQGEKKINPLDIERKILEIVGVESVSVYPEDDDRWGQIVVASVVSHKKSGIDRELIDSHCRESLSAYKLPKKYYIKTIKEEN